MTSSIGMRTIQPMLLFAALMCWYSTARGTEPAFAEGAHVELIERVATAQTAEYRRTLAAFDVHMQAHPQDEIAAVERCRFILNFAYSEEFPIESAYADGEACRQAIASGPHASTPAARLFLLEQTWGEAAIGEAEALLPAARQWTSRQQAALHARLSDLYAGEDPDRSGRHAITAIGLDPGTGRQFAAAEYQIRIGQKRQAIETISSLPPDQWSVWNLRSAVQVLLQAGDAQAALGLATARSELALDASTRLALARALLEAGDSPAGRTLLDDYARQRASAEGDDHYPDVAALREFVSLQRDFGSTTEAIAAYASLRAAGSSADPFAWYRLSLASNGIAMPWTLQDFGGIGSLLALLGLMALLPALIVVPIHYRSVAKRARGTLVTGTDATTGWRLRHLWYAFGAVFVMMVTALYVFAYPYFESAIGILFSTAPYGASPIDDVALGRSFLWGAILSLIALLPLLRQVPARTFIATRWTAGRALAVGASLALGFVFVAMIFHAMLATGGFAIGLGSDTLRGMRGIHQAYGAWALLGFAAVLTPMIEEFVFRGVCLQVAASHLAWWAAALLQAIAFVLWHEEFGDFPALFLFALLAAWLARRSGGLLAPFTFHAVVNLIAVSQVLRIGASLGQGE